MPVLGHFVMKKEPSVLCTNAEYTNMISCSSRQERKEQISRMAPASPCWPETTAEPNINWRPDCPSSLVRLGPQATAFEYRHRPCVQAFIPNARMCKVQKQTLPLQKGECGYQPRLHNSTFSRCNCLFHFGFQLRNQRGIGQKLAAPSSHEVLLFFTLVRRNYCLPSSF